MHIAFLLASAGCVLHAVRVEKEEKSVNVKMQSENLEMTL